MKISTPSIDFMMPGFPRCGTTTLAYHLADHPGVFMTTPKEPGFFKPKNYKKRQSWNDYAQLFAESTPNHVKGEGTVTYTTSWPSELADPELVYSNYPNLKLIFMMRDPIERIVSQWINKTQQNHPKDIPVFDKCVTHYSIFLNTSRYWNHISRWLEYFDDDQVLAICLEQFKEDPERFMRRVERFLGIKKYSYDFSTKLNASDKARRDSNIERHIKKNQFVYEAVKIIKDSLRLDHWYRSMKSEEDVEWDQDILWWVQKELDSDSRTALQYAGLDPSYWPKMFPDG